MPSIWITSKSRPERSDAIHSFMRAADSATKRREAADFDRPAPSGAGTSPSGNRTERANLRVETLISIWFIAHLPSQSSRNCRLPARQSLLLAVEAAKPWSLDLDLAAVEADLALRFPPAVRPPVMASRVAWTTDRLRVVLHHLAKRLHARKPGRTTRSSPTCSPAPRASALSSGIAVDVVSLFMALLSFRGISTPSLPAQGEQRRSSYFNIDRDNS